MKPVAVLWRIEKAVFARTVRQGDGARLHGGRWNSPGRPVIYCSGTLSLAMLEILAHVNTSEEAGTERIVFRIEMDEEAAETISVGQLPKGWRSALDTAACRRIGDAWLARGAHPALRVPSALVPEESNVLLNPLHPDFAKAFRWERGRPLRLDARLTAGVGP